jgi:hypothetical protein
MTGWLTSYFQHSGLPARDLQGLDVVPSMTRAPSLWNISMTEAADIIEMVPCNTFDNPFLMSCHPQTNALYKAAIFDKAYKDKLPHMKSWLLVGDASLAVCISALWSVQDDDKAHGGGNVNYKVLPGMNHFVSCCHAPFHPPGSFSFC